MNTKAGRKDPRYTEIFDTLRDLEYTVRQARSIAGNAVKLLDEHPDWTMGKAILEACFNN